MSYNPSEFKQHFPSIAAHLGPTGAEIFTRVLIPTKATAGDVLISYGAKSDTLYLIWQGLLAISIYLDAFTAAIETHDGKVLHFAGDAVLADFASVVDALTCALGIQRALKAQNEGVPDDRKLQFRIGINLGDVIVDRNEIYDDGVNGGVER